MPAFVAHLHIVARAQVVLAIRGEVPLLSHLAGRLNFPMIIWERLEVSLLDFKAAVVCDAANSRDPG